MKTIRTHSKRAWVALLFIISTLINTNAKAQLIVTDMSQQPNWNADSLVRNVLLDQGVSISNVKFNGSAEIINCNSIGVFNTGSTPTNLGIESGVIIASGGIQSAIGPNNDDGQTVSTNCNGYHDDDLASIASGTTNDVAVLEFDFIPWDDTLKFNIIFGSEEYMEYVGSGYNDVFGFFVEGINPDGGLYENQNMALIPGTTEVISINNVNLYHNSNYYVDNSGGTSIQFDGFTTLIEISFRVIPLSTYHIKMAICDVGDDNYDSGVFIEANSFSTNFSYNMMIDDFDYTEIPEDYYFCSNRNIEFQTVTNWNFDNIIWYFGDGTSAQGNNVTHSYDEDGFYTVTNVIHNPHRDTDSLFLSKEIEVRTFSSEEEVVICDGPYLWHGQEIAQSGTFVDTLISASNCDSITTLFLTINPSYHINLYETACDSFYWNNTLYTESGEYIAEYQTVHSCDSILTLHLTITQPEPLGEFTYMSPTDNYPISTLPIVFSWDAVPNAQYYDLYLWNANDSIPTEPFVSGLTNGYYSCASLPNHQTYRWYVRAYNPCNEVYSGVRSFTLDVEPALNVSLNNINFGEVALNQSESRTLNVSGIVLEDSLNIELVGDDASMFSFATASDWNEFSGGQLTVTFQPTAAQWDYQAALVISSGSLTQSVALLGSVADVYVFNTYVDEEVYAMNTAIPIHGSVMDNENTPVANAEVEIGVFVMGMRRNLQATTDENGMFSATFEPMSSESGYYTVNSGRVGNNSTAVHDDFNIPGMAIVVEGYILCPVTQNQPKTDFIRLRNKSNLPLNDIQVSVLSAPEGCSISFVPMSLGGMETNDLVFTINGTELTQGNQYQEIKLRASSSEGATTDFSIWYYCMEPRGILNVAPNSIATTMTKGKSKIIDLMVSNHGTGATGEITINLPEVEWMSVVGNNTLPSLAVNDSAYFSLRLSPSNDIPLVQYSGNIAVNCEHGEFVNLPFSITAVSDSTGSLRVDVTDEYTYYSNNGPHLANAEVTVRGYFSLETVAHGYTNDDGTFDVENLPEGYYRIYVSANRHDDYNGTILIDAGTTNQQDVFVSYQAVTYGWNVVSGEIQDEYEFVLNTTFETNVPAPVITIEAPESIPDFEVSYNFNYIITNHGLIDAYDIVLHTPEDEDFLFTALFDNVDTIHAQSTVVIPCMVTRLTNNTNICKHWVCSWVIYNYISGPNTIYRNAHDYTLLGTEQCGAILPSANGGGGAPGFGGGWGGGSGQSSLYIHNIPVDTPSGLVCVQVGVQFNQHLVMTREAFFGTFSVHNGFDTASLEGIGLNFEVKDSDDNDCTDLFQISTLSLNNITSIDGDGSLGAGLDGMAQILFIPTREAAPTEPKDYYFGGTFTFCDPYLADTIVCDLYPVQLTVHPCPDLYVDYFMQRDIIGDDALTLDVVEPSVPAELGVIINNKGAGVAKNVILETAEPKIVENSQGLIIDFSMYGASFNGNEAQLGLMEIPFGNIESGHTAVGEWLFTSSLLGHFVSYDAHVIHNNSYGNPNLSLVSHLDIHELIHPIRAYGNLEDGINDFLVNDVPDEHSYPDSIYFSNGGRTGVSIANHISFDHYVTAQDTIVTLTVRPSKTGWNYGVVDDPGSGYVLVGCMRNIDNQVIPLHNVWQTFVTLRDEQEPIYENKLHFVDTLSNGRQDYTYTLIYSLNEPTSPCQINIEDELCEGDDYTQYGFNLTDLPAGTYDETLYVQNTFGYDNIVSLHLVVYETPEVHIQIDTIHENGISFRLTATGAEHYEWSTGETTASIIVSPTEETTYSVIGTSSHGCSDSAEVTVFGGTGIGENGQMSSVKLYPNPAHDKLFIKTSELVNTIEIYTMTGVLVQQQSCWSDNMEIDVQNLSSGIYVIRLASDHAVETRRFVKE